MTADESGLCDFRPERGQTCDRCDRRLWFRVFWVRTSYECVEGDYVCPPCYREATGSLLWWERLRDWFRELPCRFGRHRPHDWGDGLVLCAKCWSPVPSQIEREEKTDG